MFKKILSITMILVIIMASASFGFAEGKGNKEVEKNNVESSEEIDSITGSSIESDAEEVDSDEDVDVEDKEDGDVEDKEDGEEVSNGKGKGKGLNKEWKSVKEHLQDEKDLLEEAKDLLEEELEILEEQYEIALEAGDEATVAELLEELNAKKVEFDEAKAAFKVKLGDMKAAIKAEYTDEELEAIEEVTAELEEEYEGIKVLPIENVINKKGKFKFDVPPVIKEGRTLIPVRAISEGFGAEVGWDQETKTVTITKGETVITLKLDDRTATVNDEAVELDVAAELMNNRTVVPLRFIAESLGLKVDWDGETETIELDEEESDSEEVVEEEVTDEDTTTEDETTEN